MSVIVGRGLSWPALGVVLLLAGMGARVAHSQPVDFDSYLSSNTAIYVRFHAGDAVDSAWRATAARRAVIDSGLFDFLRPLVMQSVGPLAASSTEMLDGVDVDRYVELTDKLVDHVAQHGLIMGGDIRLLAGEIMLVLPNAAGTDLAKMLDTLVREACEANQVEVKELTVEGRQVASAKIQTFFVNWWVDGPNLILVGNQLGPNAPVRRVAGKSDGLNKSPRYANFKAQKPYTVHLETWIDAQLLMKLVPQTLPDVPKMMDTFGLKTLHGLVVTAGFEGEALRTDYDLLLAPDRLGPWKALGGPALALDKLPKLPPDVDMAWGMSLDAVKIYDTILETIAKMGEHYPESGLSDIPAMLVAYEETLGYKLRDEILAALGQELVVYSSPLDGPLMSGLSAAVSVKDRDMLTGAFDRLVDLVGLMDPKFLLEKKEVDGVTYYVMGYEGSAAPVAPTVAVTDQWLIATLVSPAAVGRFVAAQSASDAWSVNKIRDTLPAYTGTMTGVIYSDPRDSVKLLLSFLPLGINALHSAVPELDIDLARSPRVDTIVSNTFPGTAVMSADEAGLHLTSRFSLPLTNPEAGLVVAGSLLSAWSAGAVGPFLPGSEQPMVRELFDDPMDSDQP